jgi:sugar phosphate isomerase/epimerase
MTSSRREFLVATAASSVILHAAGKSIPVGLELYSVREDLKKDLMGTVQAVAKMGYQCVEFFSPYYQWTPQQAREVRALLDDLGVKCYSTHNDNTNFTPENLLRAIELNSIIGSENIVMASSGKVENMDGWKRVAEKLNDALEKTKPAGIRTGYHNHQTEFQVTDGVRPMEILAANTHKDVMLQLDVGTCVEAGSDPVAWINANPGRIRSLHCKDWGPEAGYKVLFGEGAVPWPKVFEAAEKSGGVEFYLIEQEGSRYPAPETAERCLAAFRKIHKS